MQESGIHDFFRLNSHPSMDQTPSSEKGADSDAPPDTAPQTLPPSNASESPPWLYPSGPSPSTLNRSLFSTMSSPIPIPSARLSTLSPTSLAPSYAKLVQPPGPYFYPYRQAVSQCFRNGRMQSPLFRAFPPRDVSADLTDIWKIDPTIIDSSIVLRQGPDIETAFEDTPFRVQLFPSDALNLLNQGQLFPLNPSTTFVFREMDAKDNRYLIDYCQWIYNHRAFLKVSGITSEGTRIRSDDPWFPSFIFMIPVCLIGNIPILSGVFPYIRAEAYSPWYANSEGEMIKCRICTSWRLRFLIPCYIYFHLSVLQSILYPCLEHFRILGRLLLLLIKRNSFPLFFFIFVIRGKGGRVTSNLGSLIMIFKKEKTLSFYHLPLVVMKTGSWAPVLTIP